MQSCIFPPYAQHMCTNHNNIISVQWITSLICRIMFRTKVCGLWTGSWISSSCYTSRNIVVQLGTKEQTLEYWNGLLEWFLITLFDTLRCCKDSAKSWNQLGRGCLVEIQLLLMDLVSFLTVAHWLHLVSFSPYAHTRNHTREVSI